MWGLRSQVDLGHVSELFVDAIRGQELTTKP
jgi:hypothetical protein